MAIDKTCTSCSICLNECPTSSIAVGPDHYYIDTGTCDEHGSCVAVCPVAAIHKFEPPLVETETGKKP